MWIQDPSIMGGGRLQWPRSFTPLTDIQMFSLNRYLLTIFYCASHILRFRRAGKSFWDACSVQEFEVKKRITDIWISGNKTWRICRTIQCQLWTKLPFKEVNIKTSPWRCVGRWWKRQTRAWMMLEVGNKQQN